MDPKRKILYVDDELINLKLFWLNLKQYYEIIVSLDPLDGLKKLKENPDIKIAFSDLRMPTMNGHEFIQRAKQASPNTEFFLVTGYYLDEKIIESLNSGLIKKHFVKPIDFDEIRSTIELHLENAIENMANKS
jgi:two-component system response regulator (stage 0 sporulation protein F)